MDPQETERRYEKFLVVAERKDRAHDVLARSVMLARHLGARLELFLCDAEPAYALSHLYDSRGVEEAKRNCLAAATSYLESLRQSIVAEDVQISIDAACESPLYEGIVRKVLRSSPDLVIKGPSGNGDAAHATLDANDWHLVRTCPVPLLVVRGAPWQPQPKFAAAVDVSGEETPGFSRAILRMTTEIARRCRGSLEILYGESPAVASDSGRSAKSRQALQRLGGDFGIDDENIHIVTGDPSVALPEFASRRGYDVLALGALTHRRAPAALVGTLTGKLLDTLACDFLLVKPDAYVSPLPQAPSS